MIPADYVCGDCGAEGVKLWRGYMVSAVELRCASCTEKHEGGAIDLSQGDQCRWSVPAVPDLRGGWWPYTSVPAEGCAWWKALPLRLTGEWSVRGGVERWMPYRDAMKAPHIDNLLRVDLRREGGAVVLVFVPERTEVPRG